MRTIYARTTTASPIDIDVALAFLEAHHRSGATVGVAMRPVGLLHGEELVAVALFANPRTRAKQREYTTELLRLAFKTDTRVTGGASKLIKYFINEYSPVNLFTYQDTTGEKSDVYGKAGMTLVSEEKNKQYLVAPGKTLDSAARGEYYSMGEVVRRGPDALLKTSLGEVRREDGTRKTNPELFVEELGWSLFETSGDRVWAWHNPAYGFYVYRITSTVDESYYVGRHQYKKRKSNATTPPLLEEDGYFGSGGAKYKEWVEKVGQDKLVKTIVKQYGTYGAMNAAELKLIGDLYKTDPLCKNTLPGGTGAAVSFPILHELPCERHGQTKHTTRGMCLRCIAAKTLTLKQCEKHGQVFHTGESCLTCIQEKLVTTEQCETGTHGMTKHRSGHCARCLAEKAVTLQLCGKHGEVKFLGANCYFCKNQEIISMAFCEEGHGVTAHKKDRCMKCSANTRFSEKWCKKHEEFTTFSGDNCAKCVNDASVTDKVCSKGHGLTKHIGDNCYKCSNAVKYETARCEHHGFTDHSKGKCRLCKEEQEAGRAYCTSHGFYYHVKDTCLKCVPEVGGITVAVCGKHGEGKFRGGKCYSCMGDAIRHARKHKDSKDPTCHLCAVENNSSI